MNPRYVRRHQMWRFTFSALNFHRITRTLWRPTVSGSPWRATFSGWGTARRPTSSSASSAPALGSPSPRRCPESTTRRNVKTRRNEKEKINHSFVSNEDMFSKYSYIPVRFALFFVLSVNILRKTGKCLHYLFFREFAKVSVLVPLSKNGR